MYTKFDTGHFLMFFINWQNCYFQIHKINAGFTVWHIELLLLTRGPKIAHSAYLQGGYSPWTPWNMTMGSLADMHSVFWRHVWLINTFILSGQYIMSMTCQYYWLLWLALSVHHLNLLVFPPRPKVACPCCSLGLLNFTLSGTYQGNFGHDMPKTGLIMQDSVNKLELSHCTSTKAFYCFR